MSLPSSAVAAGRAASVGVGAYARIRKQFKVPIAEMGGVQEALGRIATEAYILSSAQYLINSMLAKHEQPAVLSAVMKMETTHRARNIVNDAMDVLGGSAICRGKQNLLGNGYMNIPIAVTVEGANILTRTLIIFGQGLNRAHPHLIHIINALEKGDDVKGFSAGVSGFVSHLFANATRSVTRAITRPRSKSSSSLVEYYDAQLSRQAANFAVAADLALSLGGRLKFEEMLSGRFADAFGSLYLGYACLYYYQQNKHVEGIDKILEVAMESLLKQNQTAIQGIASNFPHRAVGRMIDWICYPTGSDVYHGPTDKMRVTAANLITNPTEVRKMLGQGVFISDNPEDKLRKLTDIFPKAVEADKAVAAAKKTKRELTKEERALVDHVNSVVNELIQVDSFDKLGIEKHMGDNYIRPGLRGTRFAELEKENMVLTAVNKAAATKDAK